MQTKFPQLGKSKEKLRIDYLKANLLTDNLLLLDK